MVEISGGSKSPTKRRRVLKDFLQDRTAPRRMLLEDFLLLDRSSDQPGASGWTP